MAFTTEAFGTVKTVPYRAFYSGQPTIKQPVGRGHLTTPEPCLIVRENLIKKQENKEHVPHPSKMYAHAFFYFYNSILSPLKFFARPFFKKAANLP